MFHPQTRIKSRPRKINKLIQISFIEPTSGGHHGTYLKWLWESVTARGFKSNLITTREALESSDFAHNLNSTTLLGDAVELDAPASRRNGNVAATISARLAWAGWLRHATAHAHKDALLFLPYGDLFLYQAAIAPSLMNGRRWSSIMMSPTFHHPSCLGFRHSGSSERVKELLFGRLLRQSALDSLFCIDPLLPEYCRTRFGSIAGKLHYFPDPVETLPRQERGTARRALSIDEEAFVILCYGSIAMRKGLKEIVSYLTESAPPCNLIFIIAGEPDGDAADLMASELFQDQIKRGRAILYPHYVSSAIEATLFSSADLVWAIYPNFYQMSGVAARAIKLGIPFLAPPGGLMEWYVTKIKSGIVPSSLSTDAISRCINNLIANPQELKRLELNCLSYKDYFSVEMAKTIVSSNIC